LQRRKSRHLSLVLSAFFLAAGCSDGPAGVGPVAPAVNIVGVQEGQSYIAPITIDISVDRGSYTATLNNAPYTSGTAITGAGQYVLQVNAQNGSAVTSKTVHFTLTGGAVAGVTIIKLINLGANDSGGGGDAILITDSTNGGVHSALVDAGPAGAGGSDLNYVQNRLKALGVDSLDFVMLTHAHGDHYLGMNAVLNGQIVKRFIYNGQVRTLASYQSVVNTARNRVGTDSVIVPTSIKTYRLGRDSAAALVTVLPPLPRYLSTDTQDGDSLNEGSVGMQLKRGTFEMFFTGDSEEEATQRWRVTFPTYTANLEVLKVGHHGANNAIFDNGFNGTSSWLAHTNPQVSVISANGTTHPRLNALAALLARSTMRTYCTNVHGEITIRVVAGGSYTVSVEKNSNMDCQAGSQATT